MTPWTNACTATGGTSNFYTPWSSALHGCSSMAGARILRGGEWYQWMPASDNELTLQLRVAKRGADASPYLYIDYDDGTTCNGKANHVEETYNISPVGYGFADNCASNSWSDKTFILTPPAGSTMLRLKFSFDGAIQSGSITENATTPDTDPYASTIRGPPRTSRAAMTRASPLTMSTTSPRSSAC